jgi:hypothetical protein
MSQLVEDQEARLEDTRYMINRFDLCFLSLKIPLVQRWNVWIQRYSHLFNTTLVESEEDRACRLQVHLQLQDLKNHKHNPHTP